METPENVPAQRSRDDDPAPFHQNSICHGQLQLNSVAWLKLSWRTLLLRQPFLECELEQLLADRMRLLTYVVGSVLYTALLLGESARSVGHRLLRLVADCGHLHLVLL